MIRHWVGVICAGSLGLALALAVIALLSIWAAAIVEGNEDALHALILVVLVAMFFGACWGLA